MGGADSHPVERLHKYMARCGVASRRKAEDMILEGRVTVNGALVTGVGAKVGGEDEVRVDGRLIRPPRLHYLLLNKPKGYVTTLDDPQGRATIVELLPDVGTPLKPVGRLDKDTEGLLIVTNDGELAMRLSHPRYEVEKEYRAIVEGHPTDESIAKLESGVFIEGGKTRPAQVERLKGPRQAATSALRIVLHEGRKRQVRLMCEAVGHPVVALTRTRIGPIRLRDLRPGACRLLGHDEVQKLRTLVGLADAGPRRRNQGR